MTIMTVPIAQSPWTSLGKKLESTFRKALFDYEMLKDVSKIAVALSGGKDSLTLLYLLKAISGRGFPNLEIHAIHVSGEFSCGAGVNEDHLRAICQEIGVQLTTRISTQKLEKLECYSCSRERRRLLFEAAKSLGITTIAFGHHRDDHTQTVLMNLLHKAEFAGNLPKIHMQEYGVTIIRPLIYIAEKNIRTFAQQQGFARIMCRCPVGQNSMRKQVDQLLIEIETLFPHARENIAKAGLIYGSQKAATP
nr:tRNA 2-thiocytidine biosynthesis TtcA family protein [Candidatus Protochlamydia amoebophila]